jgi:hypothetical protein
VALRITPDLPDDSVIDTWFAEPVRLLLIPSDTFLTNRNAYSPTPQQQHHIRVFHITLVQIPRAQPSPPKRSPKVFPAARHARVAHWQTAAPTELGAVSSSFDFTQLPS